MTAHERNFFSHVACNAQRLTFALPALVDTLLVPLRIFEPSPKSLTFPIRLLPPTSVFSSFSISSLGRARRRLKAGRAGSDLKIKMAFEVGVMSNSHGIGARYGFGSEGHT